VQAAARANNAKFVEQMRGDLARVELRELAPGGPAGQLDVNPEAEARRRGMLGDLPISLYNGRTLADAWGNPIVFMADQHPAIGMAPLKGYDPSTGAGAGASGAGTLSSSSSPPTDGRERASFFVSAGPDGRYLTREDNLYSYEQARK
jgi:hypothetical protein